MRGGEGGGVDERMGMQMNSTIRREITIGSKSMNGLYL